MTRELPRDADFFVPILTVLADGESRTSRALKDAVFALVGLTDDQIDERFETSGSKIADTRAQFAMSALRRAEAIEGGYGVARITDVGRRLLADHPGGITEADLREIPAYRDHVPATRTPGVSDSDGPAVRAVTADKDATAADESEERTYWFVGASFADTEDGRPRDHTPDFLAEGRWAIHPAARQFLKDQVSEMRVGDGIAIKAVYYRLHGVPFETNGNVVSIMDIKATGRITGPGEDGLSVTVAWEQDFSDEPLHWYLYTYQSTIWKVIPSDHERKAELVDVAFHGKAQDVDRLRNEPYWADRFGDDAVPRQDDADPKAEASADVVDEETTDGEEVEEMAPTYTVESIGDDGCFLEPAELKRLLQTLRQKKNLILQGPPGTGKTWLAKRLGRALVETTDPELITSVQFHPTVSYEDFVRGWRPSGDGTLKLVDGTLLEIAERAAATPDTDHVLVIEEINRGNLAQIFGEMLTLLEADKRSADHAMRLTYRREKEKPFHLPSNLYLIGTMNLADRSLAMVDFALRRRFGFADLQPAYNESWVQWVTERLTEGTEADVRRLRDAVVALNEEITAAPGLGEQYQVGHSFFTPAKSDRTLKFASWARTVVLQEIRPLLAEYWYDQPERVRQATDALLAALPAPAGPSSFPGA